MMKADYEYSINRQLKRIAIVDLNLGRMSVTNCIESVVEEIAENEKIDPKEYIIVYRDSEEIWDGWSYYMCRFITLNCETANEAFEKYKKIFHLYKDS